MKRCSFKAGMITESDSMNRTSDLCNRHQSRERQSEGEYKFQTGQ
jgi:hypothetical protein